MPAKDIFHDAVKTALLKDAWLVTDEQFLIRSSGVEVYINIGAEKVLAACGMGAFPKPHSTT